MANFAGFYILGDSGDDEEEILGEAQKFRGGSRDFNYAVVPLDTIEVLLWRDQLKVWLLRIKDPKKLDTYVGIDGKNLPGWLFDKLPLHTLS